MLGDLLDGPKAPVMTSQMLSLEDRTLVHHLRSGQPHQHRHEPRSTGTTLGLGVCCVLGVNFVFSRFQLKLYQTGWYSRLLGKGLFWADREGFQSELEGFLGFPACYSR